MQRSLYLAQLIGPIFIAIGAGMLLNANAFLTLAEQFLHSYALIYLAGVITLTAGLALVLAHNVWIGDWRLIITVLGWLGVIGGTFRIVWPQEVVAIGSAMLNHPEVLMAAGFAVFVIGAVLSYYGYADTETSSRTRRGTRKRSRRA
jgi:4-amino-4-deoxy-L-arabinose transferase-like glycosyltransferase